MFNDSARDTTLALAWKLRALLPICGSRKSQTGRNVRNERWRQVMMRERNPIRGVHREENGSIPAEKFISAALAQLRVNGSFECDPASIWADMYSYNRANITVADVTAMLDAAHAV